jgi:hypothetical protein
LKTQPIVRPATREDAIAIAPRLWLRDASAEVWKRQGLSLECAALLTFESSIEAWVWEVDGEPVAMWGLSLTSLVGGKRMAWFLATPHIAREARTFWKGSRRIVAELLERYGAIEGYCDARFTASKRWLVRLGFKLGPLEERAGIPFHHFQMGR